MTDVGSDVMNEDISRYSGIIGMTRPVSKKHKPMPMSDRAAQFSSFAPLRADMQTVREQKTPTEAEEHTDNKEW